MSEFLSASGNAQRDPQCRAHGPARRGPHGAASDTVGSSGCSADELVAAARERSLKVRLVLLTVVVLSACCAYLFTSINMKFFEYAMSIRIPKLTAMVLAAICIGGASLIFQSLINNYIVTPCLLGMNALYLVLHTLMVFLFGLGSFVITSKNLAFAADLILMGSVAVVLYNWLLHATTCCTCCSLAR